MDTFSLITLAVVLLLVAVVVWLWRRNKKADDGQQSASGGDEASAPEGAFGALVPEPSHSKQSSDTETLSTQPPDFADTETGGPDTEQNTLPPELTEEETEDLLHRLQEAAALDAQEAANKQAEQRAKEEAARQAALARALREKKEAEENAAKLKALQDQALLARAQAQAAAAEAAEQLVERQRLAAEAALEKALLEKLRGERLERERLQRERLEREEEQARQEQAAQTERQAEIERKAREAQALVEAAQEQQRLDAEKLQAEKLEAENRRKKEEEEALARATAERASIAPQPPAVQPSRRAADIVVMVADDSKVVRVKASRLLTKYQYQVLLAEDGADAAAQMRATLPDLLITDVEMPGMDGFELTRHLRSNARTAHIPVIMITAADDRYRAAAQEAGVNVLLGKPYEDEDLIARIRSTLWAA
jgi:CheY-like chemotaxis protein